jgi:membrane protease YdiL (CAAX protease family)
MVVLIDPWAPLDIFPKFAVLIVAFLWLEFRVLKDKGMVRKLSKSGFGHLTCIPPAFTTLFLPALFLVILLPLIERKPFDLFFISFSVSYLLWPLVEEIVFRGLFLVMLLKAFGNRGFSYPAALCIQSAVFVLVHLRTTAILTTFIAGIVFGLVFLFSKKNLMASYAVHLGMNLAVLVGVTWFNWA